MTSAIPSRLRQVIIAAAASMLLLGCRVTQPTSTCGDCRPAAAPSPATTDALANAAAPAAPAIPTTRGVVRIKAGASSPFTDSSGQVWAADQGFSGGDTIERPDLAIANTKDPGIYRSEHYSMESFSWPLANGNYLVKLHFAETFEEITGAGQRVFSFNVQGHEVKDFDVWVKAGGGLKAYVEMVPAVVTDGKLKITFTGKIENPEINGIEILPQS